MFLDFAVCFHGQELKSTKRALRLCRWASSDCGWEDLLDKGLIMTYIRGDEQFIRMHKTLRDLGRKRAGGSRVRIDVSNRPQSFRFYQGSLCSGDLVYVLTKMCRHIMVLSTHVFKVCIWIDMCKQSLCSGHKVLSHYMTLNTYVGLFVFWSNVYGVIWGESSCPGHNIPSHYDT